MKLKKIKIKSKAFLYASILFFIKPLLLPLISYSQPVSIEIEVVQAFSSQSKLYLYKGNQAELVDSSWQSAPGTYKFTLNQNHQKGLYRVDVGKSISFDLIVADEPVIDVKTFVYAPNDSLRSSKSIENQILWEYQRLKKRNEQHTWLIRSLMEYYTDSSMLKQLLDAELYKQTLVLEAYAKRLKVNHPDLFATIHILLEQRPIPPLGLPVEDRRKYQIESWWDEAMLNDLRIMYSPAFASFIWGYVELLFNENLDKEEQDNAFIQGIDYLMNKEMDLQIREFIRSLLVEGFVDSDYLAVVEFLETNEFKGLDALKKKTKISSKDSPKINLGEKAYDFTIELPTGKKTKLSKLKSEYTLLVFWSSWCPHCIETLPRIADVYNKYKDHGLEIVAISIDDDDRLWQEHTSKLNVSWINIREAYSSGNKVLSMYAVEETPKMFLLDRTLTIISRPSTKRQLEAKLKKLIGK